MARLIFSPLIAAMSGKAADAVFASWKGRPYVRQRVVPYNPKSAAQTLVRNSMAECVALWRQFSPTLQAAFNAGADEYQYSGYNSFVHLNRALMQVGGALAGPAQDLDAVAPRLTDILDVIATPAGPDRIQFDWTDNGSGNVFGYIAYDTVLNTITVEDLNLTLIANETALTAPVCNGGNLHIGFVLNHRLADGNMIGAGDFNVLPAA